MYNCVSQSELVPQNATLEIVKLHQTALFLQQCCAPSGAKAGTWGVIFLVWDFDIQNLIMRYTVLYVFYKLYIDVVYRLYSGKGDRIMILYFFPCCLWVGIADDFFGNRVSLKHSCEFATLPKRADLGALFWRLPEQFFTVGSSHSLTTDVTNCWVPMWRSEFVHLGFLYASRAAFHQVEVPCPFHGACEWCIACMTWSTSFRSLGCCVLAASTQQVNTKTC